MTERTTAPDASTKSDRGSSSATGAPPAVAPAVAMAALVLGAEAAEIAAEAADAERSPTPESPAPPLGPVVRPLRVRSRSPRQRAISFPQAETTPTVAASPPPTSSPAEQPPPNTQSELRDWIKDNATLLSNASLLISISALALNLLPETGVLDPYIKALIFAAALLLLVELHHQWPDDLQIHMFRPMSLPENHSWRMTSFAFVMQVATLVFAVWATLTNPIILIPLTALGVLVAFRQWYFRRFHGLFARGVGVIALILTLLLSEILMVLVWALITDEQVTIELWTEERPGLTLIVGED